MEMGSRCVSYILLLLSQFVGDIMSCQMSDVMCEFWLEVEYQLTMMDYKKAVYPANGKLYHYDVTNVSAAEPINATRIVSADGWERTRLVITANHTMPGPPIEVYEGQTVVVHVTNRLTSTSVTIHWHGLHQHGTPWMDGVAFITQCPIQPGQSFTYKFKAYPTGTFWYHSHIGSQMSMGLVGAFIVRPRMAPPMEEFIMMLQDWNHSDDSDLIHYQMLYGFFKDRQRIPPTQALDGSYYSMFPFHSGLINGKGRFYSPDGSHNGAPLTVYNVEKSKSYRFRVVGSGSLYPFRVSVDGHSLRLLASDGYEIEPVTVESFVINSGERYDFELITDQRSDNYWIRAETMEIDVQNHIAEAILRYQGAPEVEPVTSRKQCSANDRCLVVNCPFSYYPAESHTDCMDVGQLRAKEAHLAPGGDRTKPEKVNDLFLNFAFPGENWVAGSANGRVFRHPPVSALTQPTEVSLLCEKENCGEDRLCNCSFSVTLEHNQVYQMVIMNMGKGKGWAHPIHMHGHSFHVVKMGYPHYNQTTGKFLAESPDIDCRGNPDSSKSYCNDATWRNRSWGGNNVPGLQLESPPMKDTLMIPSGGYAVVRIRANNPGAWFVHCHIELHQSDGMAMVLNESFPLHPPPPSGFPRCGNFHYDERDTDRQGQTDTASEKGYSAELFWSVVGCLLLATVLLCGVVVWLLLGQRCLTSEPLVDSGATQSSHRINEAFDGKLSSQ